MFSYYLILILWTDEINFPISCGAPWCPLDPRRPAQCYLTSPVQLVTSLRGLMGPRGVSPLENRICQVGQTRRHVVCHLERTEHVSKQTRGVSPRENRTR